MFASSSSQKTPFLTSESNDELLSNHSTRSEGNDSSLELIESGSGLHNNAALLSLSPRSRDNNLSLDLTKSKSELNAEAILNNLGLTHESLEGAGLDYQLLIKIIAPRLYNAFSRSINYNDIQLKLLVCPFVGEESVAGRKTSIHSFINKFSYYFGTRVWPRGRSLLYQSNRALRFITSLQTFLGLSGLVSGKAWTLLLLSLQINELIFYIEFYNKPALRNYYTPFTFSSKVDKEKILSQSLSQLPVWVSIIAVPLGLGITFGGLAALAYRFDNNIHNQIINLLNNYQPNWNIKHFIQGIRAINAANIALSWNGQLTNQQREDLLRSLIAFSQKKQNTLLQYFALSSLAQNLTAIHINDFKRLTYNNWSIQEKKDFYKTLLTIKTEAYQALEKHVTKKPKIFPSDSFYEKVKIQMSSAAIGIYASWLLWEAGYPQSRTSNIAFWVLRGYAWYATFTLIKAVIQGAQYEINFYQDKWACEKDNRFWRFFEISPVPGKKPDYYCTPCPNFPIQPSQQLTPQQCLWGLFNVTRSQHTLVASIKELKNWREVYHLSFAQQALGGDELAEIIELMDSNPKDLKSLTFNQPPTFHHGCELYNNNLINSKAAYTLAKWLQHISPQELDLSCSGLNDTTFQSLASALPYSLKVEALNLAWQQDSNGNRYLADASLLKNIFIQLPRLQYLNVSGNALIDDSIIALAENMEELQVNTSLNTLDLSHQGVSYSPLTNGTCLARLQKNLPHLKTLKINQNRYSDSAIINWLDAIDTFGFAPKLTTLGLATQRDKNTFSSFTDASCLARMLKVMPHLNSLELQDNGFANADISSWINNMVALNVTTTLNILDLSGQLMFDNATLLEPLLQHLTHLKTLNVANNNFQASSISEWGSSMISLNTTPGLIQLDMIDVDSLPGGAFAHVLKNMPNLQVLHIGRFSNDATADWISNMQAFNVTSNLAELYLSAETTFYNASMLGSLLQYLPQLKNLNLANTHFSVGSFDAWMSSVKSNNIILPLETLDLSNCFFNGAPTASALTTLFQHAPNLKRIELPYNRLTNDIISGLANNLLQDNYKPLKLNSLNLAAQQGPLQTPFFSDGSIIPKLLQQMQQLKILNIRDNYFTDSAIAVMANEMESLNIVSSLRSLDLSSQDNTACGESNLTNITPLAHMFKYLPHLNTLNLDCNGINSAGVKAFSSALVSPSKDTLPELWLVKLSREQFIAHNHPTPTTSLAWLALTNNNITDIGAAELCRNILYTQIHTAGLENSFSPEALYGTENYLFLTGNPISNEKLISCSVTNAAAQLDLLGLFALVKYLGGIPADVPDIPKLIPQQNSTIQNHLYFSYKKPPVITNRHFSLPKCIGLHCKDYQQFVASQPYELTLLLHGTQTTLFGALMGLFSCILQNSSLSEKQTSLSLSAIRAGLNYCIGFRGYGLVTREAFVHSLEYSLKEFGFDTKAVNRITTAVSMLINIGMFILQAKNSFMQVTLLTIISALGSWLGHMIAEETTSFLGIKQKKQYLSEKHDQFFNRKAASPMQFDPSKDNCIEQYTAP